MIHADRQHEGMRLEGGGAGSGLLERLLQGGLLGERHAHEAGGAGVGASDGGGEGRGLPAGGAGAAQGGATSGGDAGARG